MTLPDIKRRLEAATLEMIRARHERTRAMMPLSTAEQDRGILLDALSTAEKERDTALASVGVLKEALAEAAEGLEWALDIQVMTDALLKEQVPEAVSKLDWKTDAAAKQRATEAISASKSALANLPALASSLIAEREAPNVPRGLLEHCLGVIEETSKHYQASEGFNEDVAIAIAQLRNALRQSSVEAG